MVDYGAAFGKPFSNWKNLLVGIVIHSIPIVYFIALGYILKNAAKNPKGDLPNWDDFGDLFARGLTAFVISLIYLLPALLILILFGLSLLASIISGNLINVLGGTVGFGIGILVAILIMIITSYFLPGALLNYAVKNDFKAGFDFKAISKKVFNGHYFMAWLVGMVYTSLLVGVLAMIIPIAGVCIGGFIGGVTLYSLIGQAVKGR